MAGIVEGILVSSNMDCKVTSIVEESKPLPVQPQGLLTS